MRPRRFPDRFVVDTMHCVIVVNRRRVRCGVWQGLRELAVVAAATTRSNVQ
jgi:hypothetical protein